jgi:hypothetical protein
MDPVFHDLVASNRTNYSTKPCVCQRVPVAGIISRRLDRDRGPRKMAASALLESGSEPPISAQTGWSVETTSQRVPGTLGIIGFEMDHLAPRRNGGERVEDVAGGETEGVLA